MIEVGGHRSRGGYIGLLALLAVIAIILIVYFARSGGEKSYVETTIEAKKQAETVTQRINLIGIHRAIQQYAAVNDGRYPTSVEELSEAVSLPWEYLHAAEGEKALLTYIPGQGESSPPTNVLLYESTPGADGKHQVLLAGGRVALMTADELRGALNNTLY